MDAQQQGSYNVLDQKQSVTGIKETTGPQKRLEKEQMSLSHQKTILAVIATTMSQGTNVMV